MLQCNDGVGVVMGCYVCCRIVNCVLFDCGRDLLVNVWCILNVSMKYSISSRCNSIINNYENSLSIRYTILKSDWCNLK